MKCREPIDLSWISDAEFGFRLGRLWESLEEMVLKTFRPADGYGLEDRPGPVREGVHWNADLILQRRERPRLVIRLSLRRDKAMKGELILETAGGWREWIAFLLPKPLRRARLESFLKRAAWIFRKL